MPRTAGVTSWFSHMVGRTTNNYLRAMADVSSQIGVSDMGDGVNPHIDEIGEAR